MDRSAVARVQEYRIGPRPRRFFGGRQMMRIAKVSAVEGARMSAWFLLLATLLIAGCGLVYELVAAALASYLIGDAVTVFSTVIGTYLFAMGVGAWLARFIRRDILARFVEIEIAVGMVGGYSAFLLFGAFALGVAFQPLLY